MFHWSIFGVCWRKSVIGMCLKFSKVYARLSLTFCLMSSTPSIFMGLILCRNCTGNHSFRKLMSPTAVPYWEDIFCSTFPLPLPHIFFQVPLLLSFLILEGVIKYPIWVWTLNNLFSSIINLCHYQSLYSLMHNVRRRFSVQSWEYH